MTFGLGFFLHNMPYLVYQMNKELQGSNNCAYSTVALAPGQYHLFQQRHILRARILTMHFCVDAQDVMYRKHGTPDNISKTEYVCISVGVDLFVKFTYGHYSYLKLYRIDIFSSISSQVYFVFYLVR